MKFKKYIFLSLIFAFLITISFVTFIYKERGRVEISVYPSAKLPDKQIYPNFSLEKAPSESLKGQIATMSGEIKWQSRMATQSALITLPIEIQQGENLSTGEIGNLELIFPGAANILFSEKTEIDVIQTLPISLVFLQKSGTANYLKNGDDVISIRAKNLLVRDDGEIYISIDPKKPIITLTLKSGNATVAFNDSNFVSNVLNLKKEQTYTFNYYKRKGVLK